ncbi:MAG: hypothetical protein WAL84_10455 [Candidatus Dormiibacterota bacterium]
MSTGPHARWFRARLAGAGIIDMGAGEHASRVWRSRRVRRARAMALAAAMVLAAGCATVGLVLSIAPGEVTVTLTATSYRIGDATLHAVGSGVYSGSGTLVLDHSGPDLTAGGSAVVAGARWVAFCEVALDEAAETCRLQSGTRTLTASDVWSAGTWHRTYGDGQRVEIAAARGVPVPFPVGR